MHWLEAISPIEPVNPVRPGQVMVRNIKANSAIIQWTVAYISYSPETYIVQYGTSEESLNQNSSAKYNITITNMTYVIELSGLRGNTIKLWPLTLQRDQIPALLEILQHCL